MPDIRTGSHCTDPYGCPFIDHCLASEPKPPAYPVDLLPRAGKLLPRLIELGHRDLRKVPADLLTNALHQRVAAATRSGKAYRASELDARLASIPYPRLFLDFETVSFTIPRWLGTRPFQALPFQFSCHHETAPGEIEHHEFLDLSGESPLAEFAERLLEATARAAPIVVWNQGFEASRIRDLAAMFPKRRRALLRIIDRMVDLLPIYRAHYYHRDMRGSWSIKAVLPTIAPELSYDDMDVGGGMEAQAAYLEAIAPGADLARRAELYVQLLRYCKRDTEAMVRLMAP